MRSKHLYADLTTRIQIREVENTAATAGGMDTTYSVKATVWGSIQPLSVSTQIGFFVRDAQVQQGQPTHVIRMRVNTELGVTREGLQGNMYLFVEDNEGKGRSFRILAPINLGDRGVELLVVVREVGIQYGSDQLTGVIG